MGHLSLTAHPYGRFVILWQALAAFNLSTKFAGSISTVYEDTKGKVIQNIENGVVWGTKW